VKGDAELLIGALDWGFAFVLVLSRTGAAVMLLPGLGEAEPPAMLRAGLTLGLTALVLPAVGVVAPPPDIWRLGGMIVAELVCGAMLGWLARLIALALPMAGHVASSMIGLSSVVQLDPVLGQTSALMRLFALAVPVLVLSSGLYALPVAAIAGSYRLIGPGSLLPAGDAAETVLGAVAESFGLALRLASPFILAGLIWQLALGLMARAVPQLQAYFAAIPGQILGGLLLLGLLATSIVAAWMEAARAEFGLLPGL